MQMPIDVKSVMKAVTNTEEAAKTPISVSVWIDDTAPADLVAHVRAAFANGGANARVTIAYMDSANVNISADDDMAAIVAGVSEDVGELAARIRSAGVPVMVVTTLPCLVAELALVMGNPIPDGDIILPVKLESAFDKLRNKLEGNNSDNCELPDDDLVEPIMLSDDKKQLLDMRMGKWIITTCSDRKLAFAIAFPFVRRPLAIDSINATATQNAAVGFVPFIPGADMPIMTLNQVKMLMQIATAYGQPLNIQRLKELAVLLAGAFASRHIARSITKVIPFAGWAISGIIGFTATQAFGHAAIDYFEAGGDLMGVASVVQSARDEVIDTVKKVAENQVVQDVADGVKGAVGNAIMDARKMRSNM